ncbi:MAG TPA: hypothetical protein VNC22_23275 [Sporichthya sp.]|jgi:hypothetical protein|nr:hypothetical protein [Sporichthya sp.]
MSTKLAIDATTGKAWYQVDGGIWKPLGDTTISMTPVNTPGFSAATSWSINWGNSLPAFAAPRGGVSIPGTIVDPKPELEVVQSEIPILAHRAAVIGLNRKGLHLASLNFNNIPLEEDMDAVCRKCSSYYDPWAVSKNHDAPDPDCQCGFYAVPADVDAWHSMGTVDLLVELSGKVIEHERGYRAQHQRIVQMYVPRCPLCHEPSEFVYLQDDYSTRFFCAKHMGEPRLNHKRHLIDRETLATSFPWLSISDEGE